jgi:putative flippase GtrA
MKKRIDIQIVKFGLIGFLNTAIDFGMFALLTMAAGLEPVFSHIVSYSCGVLNSYFFNRTWTFQRREKGNAAEFLKFAFVNLISLGVSSLVLYLLEYKAGFNLYLSKLGATICSLAVNFIGSKLIVFKES